MGFFHVFFLVLSAVEYPPWEIIPCTPKKHIPASAFNQKTMYVKPDPYSFYSIMIIMLEKLFIMPSGKYVLYEQDIS